MNKEFYTLKEDGVQRFVEERTISAALCGDAVDRHIAEDHAKRQMIATVLLKLEKVLLDAKDELFIVDSVGETGVSLQLSLEVRNTLKDKKK